MGNKTDICQSLYRPTYEESIVMIRAIKNRGFSLTEVLIAMAILATGMVFIAGIFPAAIHLSTISAERVNASLAAEEAFAKIQLYAQGRIETPLDLIPDDFSPGSLYLLKNFTGSDVKAGEQSFPFIIENSDEVFPATKELDPNVFAYPSDDGREIKDKQYFWSAVLRLTEPYHATTNPRPVVQVTVFICRKVRTGVKYYNPNEFFSSIGSFAPIDYPMAVPIEVEFVTGHDDRLQIKNITRKTFINDGYTIVDDETGRIYRVIERLKGDSSTPGGQDNIIVLDRDWNKWWWDVAGNWNNNATRSSDIRVWVVPPPINGNRRPCIAIYQRELKL